MGILFDVRKFYGDPAIGRYFPELLRRTVKDTFFGKDKPLKRKADVLGEATASDLTLRLGSEDLKLIIPPVITIESQMNVKKTGIAGADGTIKEIASIEDYSINVKGFITSTNYEEVNAEGYSYRLNPSEFPEKELRQLRSFYEAKKSLEVVESQILSFFNIKKILIESISFQEFEGYEFMMPFEFSAVSDRDFVLKLTESDL